MRYSAHTIVAQSQKPGGDHDGHPAMPLGARRRLAAAHEFFQGANAPDS